MAQKNKSESTRNATVTVGIDEAGRGPVIGPLVIAALAFTQEQEKQLKWLGVKDSKLLSPEAREELFDRIHELITDFRIEMIEPDAIDLSLTDEDTNLNWLEAETSARMASEMDPDIIIIDCPSPNIPAYSDYFTNRLSAGVKAKAKIIAEHKADFNHLCVAAASIIAKVVRDRAIEHIKEDIKIDFGSGYPSDPKTKDFLEKYFDKYPHLFRKQWSSYKTIEEKKNQKTLGEYNS